MILDRNISCKTSNKKTAIIVGNSVNEIGAYNSRRIMKIESPVSLRGGKFDVGEIGAFSFINENAIIRNVEKIGRYAQIGMNVVIGWPLVNEKLVCSNPAFGPYRNAMFNEFSNIAFIDEHLSYMKKQVKTMQFKNDRDTIIGNDVYIGDNAVVRKGCNIGDGAHILPGSYVSEDVPPYAIVGGVPATVLRYRFSVEEIGKLLKLCWWDYSPAIIAELDYSIPANFIKGLEEKQQKNKLEKYCCEIFEINPIDKKIVRKNKDGSESLVYRGW